MTTRTLTALRPGPVALSVDLPAGDFPPVAGVDDARRAEWVPASSYSVLAAVLAEVYGGQVFAAHVDMLTRALDG
ncbi:hypothetical protein E1264_24525 [Actinomadura sp. KC216]|uniref:hypothetical protein n=1 Tax=Actinomadura sp. KC216 TaxID=2530370 RepID=UPI00104697AE|nr:hypothetical protein [Actinomadura sp. KC216]TDB84482.1 hypothetical protein E1264_24525 [Actinomadura sp. KC216]